MSGLAVATAARAGARSGTVANRTRTKAERLAAGVNGAVADFDDLPAAIAAADLVISCTGATGLVITEARSWMRRSPRVRPAARLSSLTWRCPAMSHPRSPACPASA